VRDGVDWVRAMSFADPLVAGFDVEARIEGRPVVFCDHELADPMHADENSIPGPGEVIHGIDFDGGKSENLLVN